MPKLFTRRRPRPNRAAELPPLAHEQEPARLTRGKDVTHDH
jgi:hypothetical protein